MPVGTSNGDAKGQLGHLDAQVCRPEKIPGLEIQI